ncbi:MULTISPECIES: hypothetical protein [Halobacterium]|uniref:DUF7519 family protein n=1 Tax=Halobacterium TaxID=2239 RepID=UPI000ABC1C5E|nr:MULTISPECIES: hypothetical protein [Halobacterium]MCG1002153.1 hypothetical protein [Halobacterium noricense]
MSDFDARPPALAVVPATVAAALAVLAVAAGSTVGLVLAGPGGAAVVYGARDASRNLVTLGGTLAFVGVAVGAATGLPSALTLIGGVAALVAYDTGEHAVTLGADVGSEAPVSQSVAVHTAGSVAVGSVVAAVGFGIYQFGPTSLPVTGLVALLFASVFLAYALGD